MLPYFPAPYSTITVQANETLIKGELWHDSSHNPNGVTWHVWVMATS